MFIWVIISLVFQYIIWPAFDIIRFLGGILLYIFRFFWNVRGIIVQQLSYYFPSFSRYFEDLSRLIEYTFNFIKNVFPRTSWIIQIILWFIERIGEIAKEFVLALTYSINPFLIYLIFVLLWYSFFYYLTIASANPGVFSEIMNNFTEFGKDVINFIFSFINLFGFLINPFLPILWSVITDIAQKIALYYSAILSIAGLEPSFTTSFITNIDKLQQVGNNFRNIDRNLATVQVIEPNAVWKNAENFVFPTNTQADEYTEMIIKIAVALLELYYTITFIILEVQIKLLVSSIQLIINLIKFSIGAALCTNGDKQSGNNEPISTLAFGCWLAEILAIIFKIVYDLLDSITEFFGAPPVPRLICSSQTLGNAGINCECGPGGLDVFTNPIENPTCSVVYICTKSTNAFGQTLWTETNQATGHVYTQNTNPSFGCPHKFGSLNVQSTSSFSTSRRNLLKGSIFKNKQCFTSCVVNENSIYGWKFTVCGNQQIYEGECSLLNEQKISPIQSSIPRRRLQEYIELYPNEAKNNIKQVLKQTPINFDKTKILTKDTFKNILDYIENIDIKNEDIGIECSSIDFTNSSFDETLFRILCFLRKFFYSVQQKQGNENFDIRRNLQNNNNIFKEMDESIWDPIERTGWNEDGIPQNSFKFNLLKIDHWKRWWNSINSDPYPFFNTYGKALTELHSISKNETSTHLQKIYQFHDAILNAHTLYITQGDPNKKAFAGIYKNILTSMYTNITSLYTSSNHDKILFHEYGNNEEDHHHEFHGRNLASINPHQTGIFGLNSGICGNINARLCPNLFQCEIDQTKCTWPEQFTFISTISLIPYYSSTALKKINVRLWAENTIECWKYLFANPSANPVNAYANGLFSTIDSYQLFKTDGSSNENDQSKQKLSDIQQIRFCFPLFGPIPSLPYLTWNFKIWLRQKCGEKFINNDQQQPCTCSQYNAGGSVTDYTSQWIYGIPTASYARLYRGLKAFQFIITRIVPQFLSDIWYTLITSILCSEQSCPEIANMFNPIYASAGQSNSANWICVYLNIGSIYYLCTNIYLFSIIFIHWSRFFWAILKIFGHPILFILFISFNYIQTIPYQDLIFMKYEDIQRQINDYLNTRTRRRINHENQNNNDLLHPV